jgi:hypothetical protein
LALQQCLRPGHLTDRQHFAQFHQVTSPSPVLKLNPHISYTFTDRSVDTMVLFIYIYMIILQTNRKISNMKGKRLGFVLNYTSLKYESNICFKFHKKKFI